jgi:predicted nucleic acid-binding protein
VNEVGSDLVAELWGTRLAVASGILSYPEGRAALASARRAGRLTRGAYPRALDEFEEIHRELSLIGIDYEQARLAGRLAEEMELRGYDAVHLAAALALGAERTTMVTWDEQLSRAATRSGLAVVPPL